MNGSEEHTQNTIGSAVKIRLEDAVLDGDLAVPVGARGLALFAHGSGSGRHSPRNRQVAAGLQAAGFATLLMDLLTVDEEQIDLRTRRLRFDIGLLARRLVGVIDWVAAGGDGEAQHVAQLPIGTFGASTGAAAALIAAAERPDRVRAVVSRGGRPDLAADALPRVSAPVLLIVGGADDPVVIQLNQQAAARLAHCELIVVPGAGHLFEEPGALEQVTQLAASWFDRWLAPATS